ncbi:MAG: alginate lyase family protein [Pyrinomonadaceae bacterium]
MGKLAKLKRLNWDEFQIRGRQKLAVLRERLHASTLDRIPDDKSLLRLLNTKAAAFSSAGDWLDHFRRRQSPGFFGGFANREATVAELGKRWPEEGLAIIEQADRILAGRFDLLGYCGARNLSFGEPVDWHLEPIAGKQAPRAHWSRLDFLDPQVAGDKKIVWELNRHQYFATLGQAYWLTGDEQYAHTFVKHLVSWMDQNPPKLGINWASSLEVSFRSISWLWAFHFFKHSQSLTPNVFTRALKFLYLHARHIETYLSTYFSPNTHLTGEALGLFYLGTLLPEFKEAKRWKSTGRRILIDELDRHVRPDGVYFEQSSYYHRYTTDFYTHFFILSQANGELLPNKVEAKLKALLNHLMYITRPDGTTPLLGDDDGGRLMMLDRRAGNDFRSSLANGAALFARPDYKFVAGGAAAETLWLLGPESVRAYVELEAREPEKQSIAFTEGGYYVMRDGWTPTANYLLFDCGPHGAANCGHAHADALAFELAANGRTILVDPGTYTYTGSKEMRDWFRSSAAHNTLTIDGESSSVPNGSFSWRTVAGCRLESWITQPRFDYLTASLDAYERLPKPAQHTRSVLFLKNNYWVIRDQVISSGNHRIDLWFHFATGIAPLSSKNDVYVVSENAHTTRLQLSVCAAGGEWTRELGWVSSCYGEKEEAPVLAFTVLAEGSQELVTFVLPQVSGVYPRPVLREIEATEGRAFEVRIEGKHDLLLIRGLPGETAGRVETARLASDFEITWARFANERTRMPEQLVLIGGQTLELEGREILKSTRRIGFLAVTRTGEEFCVESDDGLLDLSVPTGDLESLFAELNRQAEISISDLKVEI